jgi:hypothetical protein
MNNTVLQFLKYRFVSELMKVPLQKLNTSIKFKFHSFLHFKLFGTANCLFPTISTTLKNGMKYTFIYYVILKQIPHRFYLFLITS